MTDEKPPRAGMTPNQKTLRGRLGAYAQQALYDTRETTRNARLAFNQRFLDQVDPDGVLPEEERIRRALAARRAYFAGLALLSSRARGKRATS
jgi:hypothetical protein